MSRIAITSGLVVGLLLGNAGRGLGQTVPTGGKEVEAKLIAVLKSDAPQKEKAEACRQLGVIGTKEAVPALAALLGDEKLSHMARYGLEPIPDPAVDETLREALGKLKGRLLVGVIGSLGVRRDAKAVDALAKLLKDSDPDVAQAAARALGKIGTVDAAKAIQAALPETPAGNQLAFCEGLLRAAESLASQNHIDEALAIYERLRGLSAPHQVRAAVLQGMIRFTHQDLAALLRVQLHGEDYAMFAAAVGLSRELGIFNVLVAELPKLPADRQIVVIQSLGKSRSSRALPALYAVAKSGPKEVRLAAIRTVPQIPTGGDPLFALLADPDQEIAQAAQESIASVNCGQVDGRVLKMLESGQSKERVIALELIGQRRIKTASPALLKAAGDADAGIRQAAIKRLGELGGPAELPGLLELFMRAKAEDLKAAEQAVSSVCSRVENPEPCSEKLIGLLTQAQPAQKAALLRILGSVGGANALGAVRASVKDANEDVHAAAIRALGSWKTAEVLPDLLALAKSSDAKDKALGLRGYLRFASTEVLPLDQRLAIGRQAAGLVQTAEEKNLLLSALGSIPSPDALALILPYLDDAGTKDEAGVAAVSLAEKLLKGQDAAQVAAKLAEPLEKLVKKVDDPDVAKRAKAALRQTQRKAGKK